MKKLAIAAVMLLSVVTFAQEKDKKDESRSKMSQIERMTPEQKAELRVKKMTLDLNLNEKQQNELKKLFSENAKKIEAKKTKWKQEKSEAKKMTADERFNAQSKRLDEQIAMKNDLKKILTAEQMAKYEEQNKSHKEKMIHRKSSHYKKNKKENN